MSVNWRSRLTPLDALDENGVAAPYPWLFGSDDEVALDLGPQLAPSEAITNPAVKLFKLGTTAATDLDQTTAKLVGSPRSVATTFLQRLTGLERGAVYRMEIIHGAAGSRRGASLLIACY